MLCLSFDDVLFRDFSRADASFLDHVALLASERSQQILQLVHASVLSHVEIDQWASFLRLGEMRQQGGRGIGLHLLTVRIEHEMGEMIDGLLMEILVQHPRWYEGLLQNEVDQLALVVRGHVGRDVLAADTTSDQRCVSLREGLEVGILVRFTHSL